MNWREGWNAFFTLWTWGFLGWYLHEAITTGSGRFAVYAGIAFPCAVYWLAESIRETGK